VWYRAESVIQIAYAVRIAFAQLLALNDKPDLAFVEISVLPLDFVLKPRAEYLVSW
jgi:hypothetical protein